MPKLQTDKLQKQTFRSQCSIARTLEIVGDKWTLLVIRDLMWHAKHTFKALRESEEHIPSNILTDRLNRLVAWGFVRKQLYQEHPARYEYYLTEEGRCFESVLLKLMQCGHDLLGGGLFDPESKRSVDSEKRK